MLALPEAGCGFLMAFNPALSASILAVEAVLVMAGVLVMLWLSLEVLDMPGALAFKLWFS